MDKKGMGIGQVFVFIVAAITFSLIMIFGYKAVSGFIQSGEEVAFVQFKNSLEKDIRKLYTEFGALRIEEYMLPGGYEQICFVDVNADYDPELCTKDNLACDVWETASEEGGYEATAENVFLKPAAPVKLKVRDIKIGGDKDFLCVPILKGRFSLMLEGGGDHTKLSNEEGTN